MVKNITLVVYKHDVPAVNPELLSILDFPLDLFIEYVVSTLSSVDPNDVFGTVDPFIFELLEDVERIQDRDVEFMYHTEELLISNYITVYGYFNQVIGYHLDHHSGDNFYASSISIDAKKMPSSYIITFELHEC